MEKSSELVSFFEKMLARQDFLIPLVAASFQYPIHYYGMTSAALLEDLFVDAAINFRNNYHREIEISRPERASTSEEGSTKGTKGWDYQFQGEHFSHKVGKSISDIALLWDATIELPEDKKWSYDSTMVFVLSHYKNSSAKMWINDEKKLQVSSLMSYRNKPLEAGQNIFLAERLDSKAWKILEVFTVGENQSRVEEALPLDTLLDHLAKLWSGKSANTFDVFVTAGRGRMELESTLGKNVRLDYELHPGVYVFRKDKLQNIEVKKNNRAVLLPKSKVAELTRESAEEGSFVFVPSWYMAYAKNRPADLYLAQKQEFDNLNSASRSR